MLISRNYKGDIETNVIDKFNTLLLEKEEENNTTPIIQTEGVTFAYIKHNNVYRILLPQSYGLTIVLKLYLNLTGSNLSNSY